MGKIDRGYYWPDASDIKSVMQHKFQASIAEAQAERIFQQVVEPCMDGILDAQLDATSLGQMKLWGLERLEELLREFESDVETILSVPAA